MEVITFMMTKYAEEKELFEGKESITELFNDWLKELKLNGSVALLLLRDCLE